MTVHTIPADHLDAARGGVLVVEAAHDWDLTRFFAPEWVLALLESCKACDGSGHATFGNQVRTSEKCPACDGSARPWLRVDVEHICFHEGQRLLIKEVCDCGTDDGVIDSFRAHVLDVVPICHNDNTPMLDGRTLIEVFDDADPVLWRNGHPEPITLPPGDHVGRYAVLIGEPLSLAG